MYVPVAYLFSGKLVFCLKLDGMLIDHFSFWFDVDCRNHEGNNCDLPVFALQHHWHVTVKTNVYPRKSLY